MLFRVPTLERIGKSGAAGDLRKLVDASMKEDPTAARAAYWAKVQ